MSNVHVRLHKDILWLILDRPPLNILSIEMLDQLTAAMRDAVKHAPRLIVITGAGERAFSAGVDIHDHLHGREKEMLRAVYDNCAAFCDTVIAHEDATFGLPEISLGVLPPVAAAYFPALIGQNATMRLMLTGETIDAREALHLGLVHQVLSSRRFLPDAEELLIMLAT
jgi:enoyl-CoA hydratase/carnithine racemase